jgi:acyl-CoA synthetase (AMP-forming)/AMP-acid ligase II
MTTSDKKTIFDLIHERALKSPDAFALLAPGRPSLTYRALDDFLGNSAEMLGEVGIDRGDSVAMALPNGPEAATAFLAVSSIAASAPLNPAYKESEFEFYLSDLGARAIVLPKDFNSPARGAADKLGVPVIELSIVHGAPCGAFTLEGNAGAIAKARSRARPDDVALVLHTSGTTSRPKIVPLLHSNLSASAQSIAKSLRLSPDDRSLNVMPLFHVHGLIGSLLSSLSTGASVVATPGFDAEKFFAWLREFSPTWYTAVPTMHRAILQASRSAKIENGLRFIRSCSAALAPELMASLEAAFGAPVVEAYGMTEASHQICVNPLPPLERKPGSVGMASGAEVAIMADDGSLLPNNAPGEIVVRGPGVTPRYAGNSIANADAFTSSWFRTGDVGVIDKDGYVFITGRKKEMINRGGEKIATREVDEVLLSHPAVIEAVAFAMPHPTLGEDVAAACVLRNGASASEAELREYASKRLADFKTPARILIVDSVPKGPTGKLKRIGLAADLKGLLEARHERPLTPHEARISRIWGEVLGTGVEAKAADNFFQCGGDSLGAARVASRMSAAFGIKMKPGAIFASPTVSTLAIDALLQQALAIGVDEFTEMLAEIEGLSEDEASMRVANAS